MIRLAVLLVLLALPAPAQQAPSDATPVETPETGDAATEKTIDSTQNPGSGAGSAADAAANDGPGAETIDPAAETTKTAAAGPQPLVRAELTPETAVVGQPLVLRVTVLVPTWMPKPPAFPNVDAPDLIVRLPERATGPVSETVDGETWSGVSRAYRLYPMVPGEFTLPARTVTLTYADPDTTEPVAFEAPLDPVRFTAIVPAGAEGLDPLILAAGLTLEQAFEGGEGTLGQGDAVIRSVTATIAGTSALFLPPLIPELAAEPVQAYARDPAVQEREERGTLSGSRREEVTYVARYGGMVALPEIALDWFNTETGKVETATLPGRTLTVDAPAAPVVQKITPRQVALLAGAALVLAVVCWGLVRYLLPPLRRRRTERHAAWLASEEFAAGNVETALAVQDLSATLTTLALWSGRCPGDDGALEAPLAAVGAGRYGSGGTGGGAAEWRALRKAFRAERARRRAAGDAGPMLLPPLNPS